MFIYFCMILVAKFKQLCSYILFFTIDIHVGFLIESSNFSTLSVLIKSISKEYNTLEF